MSIGLSLLLTPLLHLSPAPARSQDNSFFDPPSRGAPKRTATAGSRGSCPVYGEQQPVTILVPGNDPKDKTVTIAASTVAEYPTFLWYIPQFSGLNQLGFTLLDDHTGEMIYQTILPLPDRAGVMTLKLPESQPPLKVGRWYHWVLSVSQSEDPQTVFSSPCFAEAYIGRRPLNSAQQQELNESAINLTDIWNFYAQEIIWYDALATLDQLRRQNPTDSSINRKWQATLGLVGLADLSEYPPVNEVEMAQPE